MYNFGVTELQFICAGMFFTAFAFGSQFWEATVVNALPSFLTKLLEKNFSSPYLTMWLNSQMKSSIVNGIIFMFIIILIGAMKSNWKHIRTTKKEALSQFVPISVVIAMGNWNLLLPLLALPSAPPLALALALPFLPLRREASLICVPY